MPAPGQEWGVPGGTAPGFQQPPAQPYGYGAPMRRTDAGSGYSIAGIVCGVIALLFCPLVLGLVGVGLSAAARKRGESLANVALTVSLVGLVGGMVIGAVVWSSFNATP